MLGLTDWSQVAYNTGCSKMVTHQNIERFHRWLTVVISLEPELSNWFDYMLSIHLSLKLFVFKTKFLCLWNGVTQIFCLWICIHSIIRFRDSIHFIIILWKSIRLIICLWNSIRHNIRFLNSFCHVIWLWNSIRHIICPLNWIHMNSCLRIRNSQIIYFLYRIRKITFLWNTFCPITGLWNSILQNACLWSGHWQSE